MDRDPGHIETVFIPEPDREHAVHLGAGVGLCDGLLFPARPPSQGFNRNLSVAEIKVGIRCWLAHLRDSMPDEPTRRITNIVFMGMGEPLANYTQRGSGLC